MYDPILTITTYIHNVTCLMKHDLSNDEFERLSYSSWAANELANRIMDLPMIDPEIVIDDFLIELLLDSYYGSGKEGEFIFSTAADAIEEIYLIIKRSKGEKNG